MTIAYLAPYTVSSYPINGAKGDGGALWMSRTRKNHVKLIPALTHQNIFAGYALSVSTTTDPPAGGDLTPAVAKLKSPPVNNQPYWVNRGRLHAILLSNFSAYTGTISPISEPTLSLSKVNRSEGRGWYYMDASCNQVSSPAALGGRPGYEIFITYRLQYIKSVSAGDGGSVSHQMVVDLVDAVNPLCGGFNTGLITSALAEANQGTYDLLTELAELPETIRWMYDLLGQAYNATTAAVDKEIKYKQMFKRKAMTAVQLTDALASVWMQYRYAISPIVYSLQDIEKTLGQYNRVFKTTRGFDREDEDFESMMANFTWRGMNAMSYVGNHKHRIFLKRNYDPVTLLDGFLKNISLNPITTTWELVPLSFVADWFVNIGDVLAAYTGPSLHIGEGCTYSIQRDLKFQLGNSRPVYDVEIKSYARTIIDPSSLAGFTLEFDLPWKRQLDALALTWMFSKDGWTKLLLKRKP